MNHARVKKTTSVANRTYRIRDPFAGHLDVSGPTLDAAVADAYEDIPTEERPAYVWYRGRKIDVPGGSCRPV